MNNRHVCRSCMYARGFPEAGPAPIEPVEPRGFWKRLWWDREGAWWRYSAERSQHRRRSDAHENFVKCLRNPQPVTKRKLDQCGLFRPL